MFRRSCGRGILDASLHEARLPVGEPCGQIVHREGGGVLEIPLGRCWKKQSARAGDLFGERGVLRISHNALAGRLDDSGEFAAGYEWRLRSAGIFALGGTDVGEVHACGMNPDYDLFRGRIWFWNVAYFERIWTAGAGDDDRFHLVAFTG